MLEVMMSDACDLIGSEDPELVCSAKRMDMVMLNDMAVAVNRIRFDYELAFASYPRGLGMLRVYLAFLTPTIQCVDGVFKVKSTVLSWSGGCI